MIASYGKITVINYKGDYQVKDMVNQVISWVIFVIYVSPIAVMVVMLFLRTKSYRI